MKLNRILIAGWMIFATPAVSLLGQSIAEKKANLQNAESDFDQEMDQFLSQINRETQEIQAHIRRLYEVVWDLYKEDSPPEEYQSLLGQINDQKHYLNHLENTWREMAARSTRTESYGLWHAPETTLEQLIIDYGSQDYVYLIPPEIGGIKISIDSNLPIPRASWNDMLELIFTQNGVGVQTLNPYLRQLYLFKQNHSNLRLITNQKEDLEVLPSNVRICFVLTPEPQDVRRSIAFLEKFINPNTTDLQLLGRDILLIGQVGDVQDLLKLYEFIASNRGEKDYRLLPISKVRAEEMARIVTSIFDQTEHGAEGGGGNAGNRHSNDTNGLRMIVLENMAQALFLIGTKEEVRHAEEIVRNVEDQIGGARDKTVYWYTVKHSDPEELADVLYRVYSLMVSTGTGFDLGPGPGYGPGPGFGPGPGYGPGPGFGPGPGGQGGPGPGPGGPGRGGPPPGQPPVVVVDQNQGPPPPPAIPPSQKEPPLLLYGQEGYYQEGGYIVNPAPAQPRVFTETPINTDRDNFIVDPKSGAIVMVVEADLLPKIKELMKKLDVPKKMVQIETLLFEKVLNRENSYGLNLLKIGDAACNIHRTGLTFNNIFPTCDFDGPTVLANAGVTEFFISRKKSDNAPAFDLVYRFLLNQDDVQINTSPSLLTVNQTPATIAINQDISINTGVFEVETAKGVTLKDAFTRAQYGITISIKPTIHLNQCDDDDDDGEGYDYVTLETDITFDTMHGGNPQQPDVTRRHISNQVQVPDGDTVVLGGLRKKTSQDSREAVPFLGELPGIGKLFSINTMVDHSTDMFIFITPHIVKDPKEQLTCLRQELICLRPGDIPYFLECMEEAFLYEKNRLMEGSMYILFGRPREKYYISDCCSPDNYGETCTEYDGR